MARPLRNADAPRVFATPALAAHFLADHLGECDVGVEVPEYEDPDALLLDLMSGVLGAARSCGKRASASMRPARDGRRSRGG